MEPSSDTTYAPVAVDALSAIHRLDQLPTFPASASAVLQECNKSDSKVATVIELIERDPAICTKLLSMANSPLFGSSRPVASVGQAVVLLGLRSVSQMAVAVAANAVFGEGDAGLAKQRDKAFAQSLSCATLSRLIARKSRISNPDEAFLCGVVQDVGKLVFFKIVPEVYCQILQNDPSGQTVEAESELIGIGHTEVGRNCGVRWALPNAITEVISDHHAPFQSLNSPLAQTVTAGNYYSRKWQIGFEESEALPADDDIESAFANYELADLRDEFADQFAAVEEIYLV